MNGLSALRAVCSSLALTLLVVGSASAFGLYKVTDLGTLGGHSSYAEGINASAQAAGAAYLPGDTCERAFLYSGGTLKNLGSLGGCSWGNGINASGQVAGGCYAADGSERAVLYSGGGLKDLGDLGGGVAEAAALNASGQVAGGSYTADGYLHAVVWSGKAMTDLGTLGDDQSYAYGINSSGQVVGWSDVCLDWYGDCVYRAFLYSHGIMSDIGDLGGFNCWASAINNAGLVVGQSDTAGWSSDAFLWSHGVMYDLGTLGGDNSVGEAINSSGQVVGYSNLIFGGSDTHAFLYSGGQMVDLNWFVPYGSGWTLEYATGINDAGQICGYGINPAGDEHAFLLAPQQQAPRPYQPDMTIAKRGGTYIGAGLYNLAGLGQTEQQLTTPSVAAIYSLRITNAGTQSDAFKIKGTGSHGLWQVKYFDAPSTGGNDITAQITGAGWTTATLPPGGSRDFRVQVTPGPNAGAGLTYGVTVIASSVAEPVRQDGAVASTTILDVYQPDATIRVQGQPPADFVGRGIYNADGRRQTVTALTGPGHTVTYLLRVYNDGNDSDSFWVTGPGDGDGWTVRYFDAATGGHDITDEVTFWFWEFGGWETDLIPAKANLGYVDLRVEVTPDSSATLDVPWDVLVTVTSDTDDTKVDAVKASTTRYWW